MTEIKLRYSTPKEMVESESDPRRKESYVTSVEIEDMNPKQVQDEIEKLARSGEYESITVSLGLKYPKE